MQIERREFLRAAAGSVAAAAVMGGSASQVSAANDANRLHVAVNQYTAGAFYSRDGIDFVKELDRCLQEMKSAEIDGLEAMVGTVADAEFYGTALKKNAMEMRSIYMSANFHDKNACDAEFERVIAASKRAAEFGTKVVVINPAAKEGKSDDELVLQSQLFNRAGETMRGNGVALTFHYHTTELGNGGREFHHLLCGTDPQNVGLCFDVHWSFRACGNSAVAAYDHAKLYGDRVREFHLRQSKDGVWTELFAHTDDIDYPRVAAVVAKQLKTQPHIVLEQAPENGTPQTMKAAEVFAKSAATTRKIFGA
ncbi:MAG: sugar phosphate isomerase/epimerase family protein [Thermoguttaceae bacterium]